MNQNQPTDPRDPDFLQRVKKLRDHAGSVALTDEDLTVLACEEISRTATREEQQYNR